MEIVLLACGIADKIEEELEEGSLVVDLIVLCETAVEDLQDGLQSMLQENIRVIACNQLVRNYY